MKNNHYQRFNKNADFSNIDHIVIGSGIGGLTFATWMAKAGKKVVVFEKHYTPGGFTHSFKRRNGFEWDVGVHYVGKMEKESPIRSLFDFLTCNKLDWEYIGDIYDVIHIADKKYEFVSGKENFKNKLTSYFPNEKKAINNYLKLIDKANKASSAFFVEKAFSPILSKTIGKLLKYWFHRYSNQTTLDVIKSITKNNELIAVLCGQCGNYGLTPKHSSFAAHAIVVNHFMDGGYYPKGGTKQIVNKILERLNSLDVAVYINASVKNIVTKNNIVQGIIVDDVFIPCKNVVSNIGFQNTHKHLLSNEAKQAIKFNFKQVNPSTGHLCLYVGMDKSAEDLKLPKHNIWTYKNNAFDTLIENISIDEAVEHFSYISFPSAKDPEWKKNHPNTSTIQALTVGRYEWFSDFLDSKHMKRGDEYLKVKQIFEGKMLEKLYKLFPEIKGHVIYTEVSTPLSTKHFSNYETGEIYGLEHTPERFKLSFLRFETKIKGLRFVGQDTTMVGLASAMLSGMLCASTVLRFKTAKIFKLMRKDVEAAKALN